MLIRMLSGWPSTDTKVRTDVGHPQPVQLNWLVMPKFRPAQDSLRMTCTLPASLVFVSSSPSSQSLSSLPLFVLVCISFDLCFSIRTPSLPSFLSSFLPSFNRYLPSPCSLQRTQVSLPLAHV